MSAERNACAGPVFGRFYDFMIERPWLARIYGRAVWGIDLGVLYGCFDAVAQAPDGATVLDVPCGGGLALRGLPADRDDIRFVAVDIDDKMLARTRARAQKLGLGNVEAVHGDMRSLPFENGSADLFLAISGLHMIPGWQEAVAEIARVLKPGGRYVAAAFTTEMSARGQRLIDAGVRQGHAPLPGSPEDLRGAFEAAGLPVEAFVGGGFARLEGRKPAGR